MSIDTKKPIVVSDDRGKADDDMYIARVVFENDLVVLAEAKPLIVERQGRVEANVQADPELLLFRKSDGEVLTSNGEFWWASNAQPGVNVPIPDQPPKG